MGKTFVVDITKQVNFWIEGGREDWQVANELVVSGRPRQGLFFAHLAIEKIFKGLVCRDTEDLAPPIHNLVRLIQKTSLAPNQTQLDLLAQVNAYNIEGRYPDTMTPPPNTVEARDEMKKIKGVLEWLIRESEK